MSFLSVAISAMMASMARSLPWFSLPLAALAGCSSVDEAPAPDPVMCEVVTTPLLVDESSALGFTVAEVVARFGGPRTATLEYYEGETAELSLELVASTGAELVETSYPAGVMAGDEPDLECGETRMRLPVGLKFVTADGAFAETLETTWELRQLEAFESVIVGLPIAELAGTYANPGGATELSFNITLSEADANGVVVGVIEPAMDELATEFNVARFNYDTWPQMQ